MSKVFAISDLHLFHVDALAFRGFKGTIHAFHDMLIERWNSVVSKEDCVIILGDVFVKYNHMNASETMMLLNRLNGIKHVVLGNHDDERHINYMIIRGNVKSCHGVYEPIKKVAMTHIPIHPSELEHPRRYRLNIHGHTHDRNIEERGYLNVSCDATHMNYTPMDITDIESVVAKYGRKLLTGSK